MTHREAYGNVWDEAKLESLFGMFSVKVIEKIYREKHIVSNGCSEFPISTEKLVCRFQLLERIDYRVLLEVNQISSSAYLSFSFLKKSKNYNKRKLKYHFILHSVDLVSVSSFSFILSFILILNIIFFLYGP